MIYKERGLKFLKTCLHGLWRTLYSVFPQFTPKASGGHSIKKCGHFLALSHQKCLLNSNYGSSHHCVFDKNGALFYLISFDKS